ncbi:MAG TPA: hypothetical protein VGA70_03340 [Longimicrobiales bacterium]
MELTGEVVNAAVVAAVGFLVWWGTRGQIKALRQEMDRRFEQVDRRFEQVDRRLAGVAGEIGAVRSDLTGVALAVGAGHSPERGTG